MVKQFIEDDSGVDLVEYGLLAAIFGIAAAALFPEIFTAMKTAFGGWGDAVYGLWEPPAPGA